MQAFQLKIINAVAPETFGEKIKTYIASYRREEVGVTPRTIGGYDQGKNNYCTAFGAAGCTTYNTGEVFTNEYLSDWASRYIQPKGIASMMTIAEKFARDHGYYNKPIDLNLPEARILLDAGYALVISTIAPSGFWAEGVKIGKAVGTFTGDIFTHSVYLFREKGRDYIGNSWENLTEKGFWNKIHVELADLIQHKYVRPLSVVVYKK